MKQFIQHNGTSCIIGLNGEEKEIERRFFSYWNHGATNGEITWSSETFAYFWTTPKKLERALLNRAMIVLLVAGAERFKGKRGGFKSEAKRMAKAYYDELILERYLYIYRSEDVYNLSLMGIDEWNNDDVYETGDGLHKPKIKL